MTRSKPKELREYLKARERAAYFKKLEDSLRPAALAALKLQDYMDVYWNKGADKKVLIPSQLLIFLKERMPPPVLWNYTIEVLDTSRIDEIFGLGYFDPMELPPWVYETKIGADRIEIPANRKRKKDA